MKAFSTHTHTVTQHAAQLQTSYKDHTHHGEVSELPFKNPQTSKNTSEDQHNKYKSTVHSPFALPGKITRELFYKRTP